MHDWQYEEEKSVDIDLIEALGVDMSTSPANMHDWEYERESARDAEIQDAISERIQDLEMSSGHGEDELSIIFQALTFISESDALARTFGRYIFEIWKQRGSCTDEEKREKERAVQVIGNLLGRIVRDIVSSDVHEEFDALKNR